MGEILPSLEYLKLNDSIIRNFTDIGTSFRNVRILHVARCELKEVQGITAFEQLEELYLAYNDIEDLYDLTMLTHLNTLDLEGNNVDSLEQIFYLKRLHRLTEVSLKNNPVTKEIGYTARLGECVPNLQILDDEEIVGELSEFIEEK